MRVELVRRLGGQPACEVVAIGLGQESRQVESVRQSEQANGLDDWRLVFVAIGRHRKGSCKGGRGKLSGNLLAFVAIAFAIAIARHPDADDTRLLAGCGGESLARVRELFEYVGVAIVAYHVNRSLPLVVESQRHGRNMVLFCAAQKRANLFAPGKTAPQAGCRFLRQNKYQLVEPGQRLRVR